MRILQLIDSLDAGGAERMAVHYANGLANRINYSALATTRKEGVLREMIQPEVGYYFANKQTNFDVAAFYGLRKFCIEKEITHIHAHGTSFFWAVLLKVSTRNLKVIWHDHFGNRPNAAPAVNKKIVRCSRFFDLVITVNTELQAWATTHLKGSKTIQLPNFVLPQAKEVKHTILNGIENRRIVMVANLKHPKNHLFFVEAFWKSNIHTSDWTLHIIGKDYEDAYSAAIKKYITENAVQNVYFYDQRDDISFILSQSTLGVLASTYEGFPVTLIEYAKAGLTLFSTDAGECSRIVKEEALLFDPANAERCSAKLKVIATAIERDDPSFEKNRIETKERIAKQFAQKTVLDHYLKALENTNE